MKMKMFAISLLLITAISANAEIRRAEMAVFGMD